MMPRMELKAVLIVTTMARNGTDFGIRVSGPAEHRFTAPAEIPFGYLFLRLHKTMTNSRYWR